MCAMVRMQREKTIPLAAIPVRRYLRLLRRGTVEGIPIASATLETAFVPDCRITATSVQKTRRSIRLRNSLGELSLTVLSKSALIFEAQSLELKLVKDHVAVCLHGCKQFPVDEASRFFRQVPLVSAGASFDSTRQSLGELYKASGHLDLIVKEVSLQLTDAREE